MELVEDCWTARPSDAKPLLNPLDGSTLTWTGETVFERVLPKPPKGKVWCGTELVRHRAGTKRAQDIHPLHWWLMSTSARLQSASAWKSKYKDILQAQSRRAVAREELAEMPKADPSNYQKNPDGLSAMVLSEVSDDMDIPELVGESDSEGERDDNEHWETNSSSSSVDSACGFFQSRYDEDHLSTSVGEDSDGHSQPSENSECTICLKPSWNSNYNPAQHRCRDFCMHQTNSYTDSASTTTTDDVHVLEKAVTPLNYAMAMMPEEVEESSCA